MLDDLSPALTEARRLLCDVTPLRADCGLTCGHACCAPMPGEESGMLLFPGEELLYEEHPEFTVKPAAQGTLLICPGHCDRALRPLSCMLFPLLPLLRVDGIHPATDRRAKAVCPLARQGKSALCTDFVEAVRRCGEVLAQEPEQRAFLQRLTAEQDEWKALRRALGGH